MFFDQKELKYCGKNVIIGKTTRVRQPELVSIGEGSIIDDFCYISGELEIGRYVHIGASCSLQASKGRIAIGDFSGVASGVRIFASSSDYINLSFEMPTVPQGMMYGGILEDVVIEEFVLIGANSVILPGCHLPKGFSAGALCKLTKKLPYKPWSVLIDDKYGESVRRIGVDEMLKRAGILAGKEYKK